MFDVSFSELLVIGVIALIVIGPERLPKVARTVGHLLGRAQRYVNDVKSDIRREIELDELRKFKSEMEDAAQSVHTSLRDAESSLREPAQALRQELDEAAKAATDAVSLKPANMQTPDPASTPAVAAPAPAPAAAAASTAAAPVSAAATESGVPAARQQENVAAHDRAAPSQPSTSGSAT